ARQTFGDAGRMADALNRIARDYPATTPAAGSLPGLPTVPSVRLAVDVAACDRRPLVVLFAPDGPARSRLEARVTPLAWGERFLSVTASEARDLAAIDGARAEAGVHVVQPDRFGLRGTVLTQVGADASDEALARCLREGAERFRPVEESFGEHVRAGHELGV